MAKIGRSSTATSAIACLVLVFVLLLSATRGTGAGAASSSVPVGEEKKTCLSQSKKSFGKCINDHTCRSTCNSEGFVGGNCMGFQRRCFCIKNCHY